MYEKTLLGFKILEKLVFGVKFIIIKLKIGLCFLVAQSHVYGHFHISVFLASKCGICLTDIHVCIIFSE